nr:LOW QUALITY PROTEIN: C3a anaphylatoxin chemotactic receptor-like [Lytechinus pictus]
MYTGMENIRLVVGSLTLALGIPGNLTIIIVFIRQGIKNATDVTFTALAIVDLIACIISGVKIPMVFFQDEHPWPCFTEIIGGRSTLYAGLFLTILIAFSRYQAICKPFERRIGRQTAILINIGCILFAFCIHVPFFFTSKSKNLGGDKFGCFVYGNIPWGRAVYAKFQASVFCVSATVITILYIMIYKFIHAHQNIRNQLDVGIASAHNALSKSDDPATKAAKSNGTREDCDPQNKVSINMISLNHQAVQEQKDQVPKKPRACSDRQR